MSSLYKRLVQIHPSLIRVLPRCETETCDNLHFLELLDALCVAFDSADARVTWIDKILAALSVLTATDVYVAPLASVIRVSTKECEKEATSLRFKLLAVRSECASGIEHPFRDPSEFWSRHGRCHLVDLEKGLRPLKAQEYTLCRLQQEHIQLLVQKAEQAGHVYHRNSLSCQLKGSTFEAFRVVAPLTGQRFLLTECPHDLYQVGDLFHQAIQERVGVMVSALVTNEDKAFSKFWKEKHLRNVPLRWGWRFNDSSMAVSLGDTMEDEKGDNRDDVRRRRRRPVLVKRELAFCRPEEDCATKTTVRFVHWHYDNWPDGSLCPNEHLLECLLERIERDHDGQSTIQINCRHGRGRSGTILACLYIRAYIRQELGRGVALADVTLNVAEMVYTLRLQRYEFVTHRKQLYNIYSLTHRFYEKLATLTSALPCAFVGPRITSILLSFLN